MACISKREKGASNAHDNINAEDKLERAALNKFLAQFRIIVDMLCALEVFHHIKIHSLSCNYGEYVVVNTQKLNPWILQFQKMKLHYAIVNPEKSNHLHVILNFQEVKARFCNKAVYSCLFIFMLGHEIENQSVNNTYEELHGSYHCNGAEVRWKLKIDQIRAKKIRKTESKKDAVPTQSTT
ncbi:hypothetical protein O6H91_13G012600 [Diphasiastrum complanatum]|uniref:Uncharacterized protein n=1 Tax=Diphasiastrum complanatum TaxID=34168 RepID=A0ACC2BSB8_DIPCM|nr:hypothetical protein O6H91_13G012600 [Diphasiastrum complanatum]